MLPGVHLSLYPPCPAHQPSLLFLEPSKSILAEDTFFPLPGPTRVAPSWHSRVCSSLPFSERTFQTMLYEIVIPSHHSIPLPNFNFLYSPKHPIAPPYPLCPHQRLCTQTSHLRGSFLGGATPGICPGLSFCPRPGATAGEVFPP